MLEVNFFSSGSSCYCHFHRRHILRMDALQNHWQGNFRGRGEFKNTEGFVRPEDLSGGNVPPETACMAEPLGLCQIGLATSEFPSEKLVVRNVHPCPQGTLESLPLGARQHPPNGSNEFPRQCPLSV